MCDMDYDRKPRSCNELPGHSACLKKISKDRCPAKDCKCVGRKDIPGANTIAAIEALNVRHENGSFTFVRNIQPALTT